MGKFFDALEPNHRDFIAKQKIYFVATSSLRQDTRVNVSPKGHESLQVDGNQVFHLDLTGSGAETIAHVTENGRLTVMLCAFEGAPNIMRLWCKARVVLAKTPEFETLMQKYYPSWIGQQGLRSIIVGDIFQVGTSCGYAVPYFDYVKPRDTLINWANKKTDAEMEEYWCTRNATSIDGLPNLGANGFDDAQRNWRRKLPSIQQTVLYTALVATGVAI
ncbi:hypothetical protein HDU99_004200, partial [Rhizoclosmatium hyalinum]